MFRCFFLKKNRDLFQTLPPTPTKKKNSSENLRATFSLHCCAGWLRNLCVKYFAHSTPVRSLTVKSSNVLSHFGSPRSHTFAKKIQKRSVKCTFLQSRTFHTPRVPFVYIVENKSFLDNGRRFKHQPRSQQQQQQHTSKKPEKRPRRKQNASIPFLQFRRQEKQHNNEGQNE